MTRREGFTLLEVMIAVAVLAIVMIPLVSMVGTNVARLADARRELDAMALAEKRALEIEALILAGETLPAIDEGVYEAPDADLGWQVIVTPASLPTPEDLDPEVAQFTLFAAPTPGFAPPIQQVEVRVFPLALGPDGVDPFVLLVLPPPGRDALGGPLL